MRGLKSWVLTVLLGKFAAIGGAVLLVLVLLWREVSDFHVGIAQSRGDERLVIDGKEFQLWAVAAPPLGMECEGSASTWPCGAAAMREIILAVQGKSLWCTEKGRVPGEPARVKCLEKLNIVRWRDVSSELVKRGWFIPDLDVANVYAEDGQLARQAHRGVWLAARQR